MFLLSVSKQAGAISISSGIDKDEPGRTCVHVTLMLYLPICLVCNLSKNIV